MEVTFRVNYHDNSYDETFHPVDTDLVFEVIRGVLGDDYMEELETVQYNGVTVHPHTTMADFGVQDDVTYEFDIHFPHPDENSDDDDIPSPSTNGSSSDEEIWYTPPTATGQVAAQPVHPAQPVPPTQADPFAQLVPATDDGYESEVY
jgi:hypothetical protein